jgi:hypothetical protein
MRLKSVNDSVRKCFEEEVAVVAMMCPDIKHDRLRALDQ